MTPTLTQVTNWFNEYNTIVFNGKLPKVKISFNNTRRQLGQFYWGPKRGVGIKISLYYDRPEKEYRHTLVHEMCHLYCYHLGHKQEGHGPMWKAVAANASRLTGMNIHRIHEGSNTWPVATRNQAREKAVADKKNAPALLVDLDYGSYHFIVKTTKKVLQSNDSTNWDCKLRTSAKAYKIYISEHPFFRGFQTSRSIHRGYKYPTLDYQTKIAPKLADAFEVVQLHKLFQGAYAEKLGK